jgi:small subunit ribosomal protein S9
LNFDISVNVASGGMASRIEAVRLAIARAIVEFTKDDKVRAAFVSYDRNMLVADTRRKEAYKPGDSKARAKRQTSYR